MTVLGRLANMADWAPGRATKSPATRNVTTAYSPIDVFIGTKAQYIKTSPLLRLLTAQGVEYRLIDSGQHAKTASELRRFLHVKEPDVILQDRGNIATVWEAVRWFLGSTLVALFRPGKLRRTIFSEGPGLCLIHGDTPSTLLGLIMAKRAGKTVVHLEAGLRSFRLLRPFPEEIIRLLCMRYSDVLIAPSKWAADNLRRLGVRGRVVHVGQNTNIEALYYALEHGAQDSKLTYPYCVITMHRVETIFSKERLKFVLRVVERISRDMTVVFVQHDPTEKRLSDFGLLDKLEALDGAKLRRLMPHPEFVRLIAGAEFVITDGGSIQEECYYLDRPCLVLRSETERLEGLDRNVVIGDFNWCAIEDFITNHKKLSNGHRVPNQKPSELIAEVLTSRLVMESPTL